MKKDVLSVAWGFWLKANHIEYKNELTKTDLDFQESGGLTFKEKDLTDLQASTLFESVNKRPPYCAIIGLLSYIC